MKFDISAGVSVRRQIFVLSLLNQKTFAYLKYSEFLLLKLSYVDKYKVRLITVGFLYV